MLNNFSSFEIGVYCLIWALIGALPGFYLFTVLDRNPRRGAWMGMAVGIFVGLFGAIITPIHDAETDTYVPLINGLEGLVNAALLLWGLALLVGLLGTFTDGLRGQHSRNSTIQQRIADLAYGLLLPTFVIVIAIVVFPMLWNLVLAFRPMRLRDLQDLQFFAFDDLSLENFERVFNMRGFVDTLTRTFVYTISGTFLAIGLGLIAALIVKDRFRGRNLVRGFMLFPYIAPIVSVVFVWKLLFNAQYGLFNEFADALGGQRIDYLSTPAYAFTMVILFQGWRYFPFAFLFILARIQAIPDDLYEAAKVDGAAPSQRLWYVTLPQLRAVFGTLFLLRFIWTFNKFDDVFLLTGGAANTKLITIEVYDQLFGSRNVGTASAVALVLAAVLIVVVAIYFRWFLVEEQ